jgi:hypothetical protein
MKLPLPPLVLSYGPGHWPTPLPAFAPLCLRPQKNSLHWLASATSPSAALASPLFFFPVPHFPAPTRSLQFTIQTPSNT